MATSRLITLADLQTAKGVGLVPLQSFGFSSGALAATNTAAVTSALASGEALCLLPEASPFQIASPIVLTSAQTLIGLNKQGCVIQPPANTTGIQCSGQQNCLRELTVQYATAQPVTNTGAIAYQFSSASTLCFYSHFSQLTAVNAQTPFGATLAQGEFQNNFEGLRAQQFSGTGLNFSAGGSGSTFTNIRLQSGGTAQPTSVTAQNGINLVNYKNCTFQQVNIEFANFSNNVISLQQSSGSFDSVHLEALTLGQTFTGIININNQNSPTFRNLTIQNSTITSGGNLSLFGFFSNSAAANGNRLIVDGFLELGNTFTGKLPFHANSDSNSNFNKIYVRGVNPQNSGNVVVTLRDSLVQWEEFLFDTPGGRIRNGLVGTVAPASGGLPAPFATTAGVALPFVVGDRVNNTAPTATSTTGFINTTAGSPGTWTPEPVL